MNDNDNERRLPPPIPPKIIPNEFRTGKLRQEQLPKAPIRAINIKAEALRAAVRNGNQLDWSDIHERFVDLWQEARLVIWRAKHSKAGIKQTDPATGKSVLTFVSDEKLVLQAIDTTRGILDSLIKLRREIGHEPSGIPRWAIDRIERALRNHPDALADLLKELAKGEKTIH